MQKRPVDPHLNILKDFGLSDPEIQAYTTLLKMSGGASATELAKAMEIKRTSVYPILERLASESMVTAYEQEEYGSVTMYHPIQPSKLILLHEQKLKKLVNIIPFLEKLGDPKNQAYGVRLIHTKKEFEAFYTGILDEYKDREYSIIGSASAFINIDPEFILGFRRLRAARNIRTRLLLSYDSRAAQGQNDPSLLREYKYLPKKYSFKSTIDIYEDKIVIVGPEVKALAVVIAIPPMVDIFRSIFDLLWESAS